MAGQPAEFGILNHLCWKDQQKTPGNALESGGQGLGQKEGIEAVGRESGGGRALPMAKDRSQRQFHFTEQVART